MSHRLEPLFAYPVYFVHDEYTTTKYEFNYILSHGDSISQRANALVNLNNLRKWIESKINIYCLDILKLKDVEPYITQSWVNFQKTGKDLHWHSHPNSFISGVFYFQDEQSSIVFRNFQNIFNVLPKFKERNLFNGDSISYTTKKNSLILFPSSLWHKTNINNKKETRISLSFNTWLKGDLGDESQLNKLTLK